MTKLDFPTTNPDGSPLSEGDVWKGPNGVTYTYRVTATGYYWQGVTSEYTKDSNANIHVGDTPPLDPEPGDLWWDSSNDSGRLYMFYEDVDSTQWVEASPSGTGEDAEDGEPTLWDKNGNDLEPKVATDNVVIGDGNITLKADGSAFLTGGIDQEVSTDTTSLVNSFTRAGVRRWDYGMLDGANFAVGIDGQTDPVMSLLSGAADQNVAAFYGDVLIGGTLPSAPNITLNADGNISTVLNGSYGHSILGQPSIGGVPAMYCAPSVGAVGTWGVTTDIASSTASSWMSSDGGTTKTVLLGSDGTASFNSYTDQSNADVFIVSATQGATYQGQISYTSNADLIGYAVDFGNQSPVPEKWKLARNGAFTCAEYIRSGLSGVRFSDLFPSGSLRLRGDEAASDVTGEPYFIRCENSFAVDRFVINKDGSGSMAGTLNQNASDIKFKDNIADAPSQAADIKALQLRTWDWNDDAPGTKTRKARHTMGLVAQEAELVDSDITYTVNESGDVDEQFQAIDHDVLTMKLVGALQEALAEIDSLKTRLEAAEARLTALEGAN